jgi:hypothetical protein
MVYTIHELLLLRAKRCTNNNTPNTLNTLNTLMIFREPPDFKRELNRNLLL